MECSRHFQCTTVFDVSPSLRDIARTAEIDRVRQRVARTIILNPLELESVFSSNGEAKSSVDLPKERFFLIFFHRASKRMEFAETFR